MGFYILLTFNIVIMAYFFYNETRWHKTFDALYDQARDTMEIAKQLGDEVQEWRNGVRLFDDFKINKE